MYWQWQSPLDFCFPFITGNGISCYCRHVWNYGPPRIHDHIQNNWHFVKTDYLDLFFSSPPRKPYVLITHNADRIIGEQERRYLDDPLMLGWFAVNCNIEHPKLHPIPLGIGNAGYPHGNATVIRRVQQAGFSRRRMFYANYSVHTCPSERRHCLEQTGVPLETGVGAVFGFGFQPKSFQTYMCDVASTYFVISPRGNGIDCHRHWEALYLGAIPVTTHSPIAKRYPMVTLDDWRDFKHIPFSVGLHDSLWKGFDREQLEMPALLRRIEAIGSY